MGKRILVAEDAADIRRLVRATLMRDGIEVVTVSNGAEALEEMARRPPDAAVLDISMPLVDGLETLRRMTREPRLARVPVMMLTADSRAEQVRTALASGAKDFVVKPFDPIELRRRVGRLLMMAEAAACASENGAAMPPRIARRVLVADGQPASVTLVRDILGDRYDVATARSGAGVLAAVAREVPDVILIEPDLPIMSGVDVVAWLRAQPGLPPIPVLAMSRGTMPASVTPFDGWVTKPVEREALRGAVAAALAAPPSFSFVVQDGATILRVHEPAALVDGDLAGLPQQAERAIGHMMEAGREWLVVDLEAIGGESGRRLDPRRLAALASMTHAIVRRAGECHLRTAVVVPFRQAAPFEALRADQRTAVTWTLGEAQRLIRRPTPRWNWRPAAAPVPTLA
jgi:CheY-like chemotaxis protein